MPLPQEMTHTLKDIYGLPDGQRAELIDGRMYMMAPPNTPFLQYAIGVK